MSVTTTPIDCSPNPDPAEPRMIIWTTLRCLELQIDQHEERYNSDGVVSWELIKHMVRLAKRHAYDEGGKVIAAERETDKWRTRADQANATLRETEQELQRLRQVHMEFQSEELTEARATIAELEKQLDAARAETVEMRAQRDEALNMAAEFSGTGPQFWKQIEVVKYNAEQSVKELAAAHQTILMQRHAIERLQACLTTIKTHVNDMHDVEDLMLVLVQIREALESIDASTTEPSTESNSSVPLTSSPPTSVTQILDDSSGADGPGQS